MPMSGRFPTRHILGPSRAVLAADADGGRAPPRRIRADPPRRIRADPPRRIRAVILDMDGVVTDTAEAHAAAWKAMFDPILRTHGQRPFDADREYKDHLDGRPRYDGVAALLTARGIDLPWGSEDDPPDRETVCGLGNRKNEIFRDWLDDHAVRIYDGALALVSDLRRHGVAAAVISASRNGRRVLDSAGVGDRFDLVVDGTDAARHGLTGKPDPAIFRFAADRLGVVPAEAAVVEDAAAGVEAGAAGGFALVVGVDRRRNHKDLEAHGAHVVVRDLANLVYDPHTGLAVRRLDALPPLWDAWDDFASRLQRGAPVVFLDFDGTLSPIVSDPDAAALLTGMKEALRRLSHALPTTVISGRDLDDVRERVGLDNLVYAGSHGFDIAGPDGLREQVRKGTEARPALDSVEEALRPLVAEAEGAHLERQAFSMTVHTRNAADGDARRLRQQVSGVLEDHPTLRLEEGRRVLQVKPRADWDKGRALLFLLDVMQVAGNAVPLYVGDDITDEDAFEAIAERGIGIVVRNDGNRATAARFTLDGPEDVRRFLEALPALATQQRTETHG